MKFKVDTIVINDCYKCSHYCKHTYPNSGKCISFCDLSSKKIDNIAGIPNWCELPDYEGNQFLNKVIDKILGRDKQQTT